MTPPSQYQINRWSMEYVGLLRKCLAGQSGLPVGPKEFMAQKFAEYAAEQIVQQALAEQGVLYA